MSSCRLSGDHLLDLTVQLVDGGALNRRTFALVRQVADFGAMLLLRSTGLLQVFIRNTGASHGVVLGGPTFIRRCCRCVSLRCKVSEALRGCHAVVIQGWWLRLLVVQRRCCLSSARTSSITTLGASMPHIS